MTRVPAAPEDILVDKYTQTSLLSPRQALNLCYLPPLGKVKIC